MKIQLKKEPGRGSWERMVICLSQGWPEGSLSCPLLGHLAERGVTGSLTLRGSGATGDQRLRLRVPCLERAGGTAVTWLCKPQVLGPWEGWEGWALWGHRGLTKSQPVPRTLAKLNLISLNLPIPVPASPLYGGETEVGTWRGLPVTSLVQCPGACLNVGGQGIPGLGAKARTPRTWLPRGAGGVSSLLKN